MVLRHLGSSSTRRKQCPFQRYLVAHLTVHYERWRARGRVEIVTHNARCDCRIRGAIGEVVVYRLTFRLKKLSEEAAGNRIPSDFQNVKEKDVGEGIQLLEVERTSHESATLSSKSYLGFLRP